MSQNSAQSLDTHVSIDRFYDPYQLRFFAVATCIFVMLFHTFHKSVFIVVNVCYAFVRRPKHLDQ